MKHSATVHISRSRLKELSVVDNGRTIRGILFDVLSSLAMVALSEYLEHPLMYFVAIFWAGTRIQALAILGHHATHYTLMNTKKWNEIMGRLVLFPVFVHLADYRRAHFEHHKHLGKDKDPNLHVIPNTRFGRLFMFPATLLGYSAIFIPARIVSFVKTSWQSGEKADRVMIALLFLVPVLGLLFPFLGKLMLLYWILPFATVTQSIFNVRNVAEHGFLDTTVKVTESHTTYANVLERFIFAPYNSGFHQVHHFYASVPWDKVEEANAGLLKDEAYREEHPAASTHLVYIMRTLKA